MAFILKGAQAEIEVPVNVVFSKFENDEFSAVTKRGNDVILADLVAASREGEKTDRQLLDDHLIRLNGLTGANGELINGTGVLNWIPEHKYKKKSEAPEDEGKEAVFSQELFDALSQEDQESVTAIELMMLMAAYRMSLVNAVFEGASNRPAYNKQRMGNF